MKAMEHVMRKLLAILAATGLAVGMASPAFSAGKSGNNAGGGPGNSGPGDKASPGLGKGGVGPWPGPGGSAGAKPD